MSETAEHSAAPGPAQPSRWKRFRQDWHSWRWQSLLLLMPGTALVVLFSLQPEPALSTGPALLVDNLLRGLSLLMGLALAVMLIARDEIAERANLVAAGCGLVFSAAVLMTGLWSPFRDVVVVVLAGIGALGALCDAWLHRSVWEDVQLSVTKVLAAVLAVAAVPLFSFWTETAYLPSRNTVNLVGTIEVNPQQAADGTTHLVVSTTLENTSDVRAFVILSNLTACGWRAESNRNKPEPGESNCRTVNRPFKQAGWLDPKAKLTVYTSVPLDPARPFEDLRLRVGYARADRLSLVPGPGRPADSQTLGSCHSGTVSDIRPPSRLSSLALNGLSILYADEDGDGGVDYWIDSPDRLRCQNAGGARRLQQQLALTDYTTVWVGWPKVAPAASGS